MQSLATQGLPVLLKGFLKNRTSFLHVSCSDSLALAYTAQWNKWKEPGDQRASSTSSTLKPHESTSRLHRFKAKAPWHVLTRWPRNRKTFVHRKIPKKEAKYLPVKPQSKWRTTSRRCRAKKSHGKVRTAEEANDMYLEKKNNKEITKTCPEASRLKETATARFHNTVTTKTCMRGGGDRWMASEKLRRRWSEHEMKPQIIIRKKH